MREDVSDLGQALALFHVDSHGTYISMRFLDLGWDSVVNSQSAAAYHYRGISHDLWNLAALADRLEWMRSLASTGALHTNAWRSFSGLDVEHIFIQARSAMDHVAEILRAVLPKGGQLPDSFRKLRESVEKHRQRLQPIADLIARAAWFDDMRSVRDALVHSGAQPAVFGEPSDSLLFQVYGQRLGHLVVHELCMHNENVLRFDRYMAILFANILSFLDRLGALLLGSAVQHRIGSVKSYANGYMLLQQWIREAHVELQVASLPGGA